MYYYETAVRVLGGLPLIARFTITPADRSVGINQAYADDVHLVDRKGRRAEWAEKRMSQDDWAHLQADVAEEVVWAH